MSAIMPGVPGIIDSRTGKMNSQVELTCEMCGRTFTRSSAEVNRNRKLGRRVFCSLECTGQANIANLPPTTETARYLWRGKTPDKYSPFREYLKLIRRRTQEHHEGLALTLEDIKQQWERQNGRCPFTGWQLEIPRTTNWAESPITPRRASIDRIDSSVGYVPGNIRFVSVMANYCKNHFSDEEVIEFCRAVVAYQQHLAGS
jgi:hypothetical protein